MLLMAMGVALLPVLLCGNLLLAWLALRAGAPPELILGTVTLTTLGLLAHLERKLPHNPLWQPGRRGVTVDLLHGLISNGACNSLVQAAGLAAAFAAMGSLSDAIGIWPHQWPIMLQVLLGMLLGELCFYWAHRLAHESGGLWPWHAVHHSSEKLTVWSAPRNHPANAVVSFFAQTGPAAILGADTEALLLLAVFTTTNGMLQHTNLALRLGPLGWLLATADQHRWHHSARPDQGNSNYGSNLMIWDHLFGTYQRGSVLGPARVGLSAGKLPESFWLHLIAPLAWGDALQSLPSPARAHTPPPTVDIEAIAAARARAEAEEAAPMAASG
jgi:sterol desaturase/sphingolipid hydroxylase (fatty acid hydroxylase superfamily)